jgi:hypothetical protein
VRETRKAKARAGEGFRRVIALKVSFSNGRCFKALPYYH